MFSAFARSAVLACSAAVIMAASASSAHAFVFSGTNFPSYYPAFDQRAPQAPIFKDASTAHQYANEVEDYADKVNEYIARGNADIERIRKAQQEAVQKAKDAVANYNNWLRRN